MIDRINVNKDDAGSGAIRSKKLHRDQRGVTIIEFAIILPVLVLIIFGIIEFSFIVYDNAMLTNASREGARAATLFQYPDRINLQDIEKVVDNYCKEHLISFGDSGYEIDVNGVNIASLTDPPCKDKQGYPISVKIKYYYDFLFLPFTGINLDARTLTSMRCE